MALAVCAMACGARSLYAICQWGGMAKMSRRILDRWWRDGRDARADGDGAGGRSRTRDPVTTDEPRHQLSYAGSFLHTYMKPTACPHAGLRALTY